MKENIKEIIDGLISALSDDRCFFTCAEHRGYPLGKAFGPYSTEFEAEAARRRHERHTGHTEITLFCSPSLLSQNLVPENIEEYFSEKEDLSEERKLARCFCVADCYKGSGDSSHYRKNVDVDCSLSIEDKKQKVLTDLVIHYLEKHNPDMSDPEGVIRDIRANTEIKCYSSSRRS